MKRYRVTFYQCGVDGIEPEQCATRREANREAVDFLQSFTGALAHGHRYEGSIYRNSIASIVDLMGRTEAQAEIHDNKEQPCTPIL